MADPLWLTYAWRDNDEGDFDHLVARLQDAGLVVAYDRIELIPGRRLWEQIAARITSGDLAGWAYLVTPASLASQACREELAYALDRALNSTQDDFPLVGLLHGIPASELPPALKVRLCVDLADPDWVESVKAAVEGRPPSREVVDPGEIRVTFHAAYGPGGEYRAYQLRPRFGEVTYWRIAFPADLDDASVGTGPAGGRGASGNMENYFEGQTVLDGAPMRVIGAGDTLTPGTAAYLLFRDHPPGVLGFGVSSEPFGFPDEWMVWHPGAQD